MVTLYEKVLAYQQTAEPDRRNERDQQAEPVRVQSGNLRQRAHLLDGLASALPAGRGIKRTVPWIEAQMQADVPREEWDANGCLRASLPGEDRRQP